MSDPRQLNWPYIIGELVVTKHGVATVVESHPPGCQGDTVRLKMLTGDLAGFHMLIFRRHAIPVGFFRRLAWDDIFPPPEWLGKDPVPFPDWWYGRVVPGKLRNEGRSEV